MLVYWDDLLPFHLQNKRLFTSGVNTEWVNNNKKDVERSRNMWKNWKQQNKNQEECWGGPCHLIYNERYIILPSHNNNNNYIVSVSDQNSAANSWTRKLVMGEWCSWLLIIHSLFGTPSWNTLSKHFFQDIWW